MKKPRSFVPVTAEDYRRLAARRLPRFLFDYVDGGAGEEQSMAANRVDFRRFQLRQRVMRDVSEVDTSTVLCGRRASMPLALAPIGMAGMMARRGEVQAARAAESAGVPFTLSTVGICPVEEVSAAVREPCWFQLYMLRDRGLVRSLLERAAGRGCETLLFTVDLAVVGMRHRDRQAGMLGEAPLARARQLLSRPRWLYDVAIRGKPHSFGHLVDQVADPSDMASFKAFVDSQFDPSATWKDIEWLRGLWKGRLLIKGVMSAEDATSAADCGADGVVVSNHGGRQLDGVASCITKLPEVAAALAGRAEVLMDGGVRYGADVVKALALGAHGVLIGRPWVWALAARGEQGLTDYLGVLQQEIAVSMALMGVNRIDEITAELIEAVGSG
ncbi:MAG: L-lactate dehydrogenase [Lysobacterales bacterium]|jgi:L-lactate dehydrogenase (cytochrome)